METVLTLLSISLLLFFPGWVLLPGRAGSALGMTMAERAATRLLVSFLVTSLCGVFLAHGGVFSLSVLSGAVALCGLTGLLIVRRDPVADEPVRRFRPADLWLPVLLAVALFAAAHPFEVVTGGGDAGVYVNSGVLLAETGGLELSDRQFDDLQPRDRRLFSLVFEGRRRPYHGVERSERRLLDMIYRDRAERFRGMFLEEGDEGGISRPQFLPLLPVWMAILHSWGGLSALLRVNALLGLLSLLAIHLLGSRLFGDRPLAGMALSGLLALNVAQSWFMRYPSAELLVQALLFCGSWLVLAGGPASRPARRLVVCGGALLGAATMAKFFGIFLLLPLGLAWFFSRVRGAADDRQRWRLLLSGLLPVAGYGLISALVFSSAYLRIHLFNQQYFKFYLPAAGLVALALVTRRWIVALLARFGAGASGRLIRRAGVILLAGAALYGYFIRPRAIEVAGSNNFVELGWYVAPLGLLLGLIGFAAHLLGRGRMPGMASIPFLPWVAFLASLVVMSGTADMPLHIFSIRRMVPVTIPAFLIFGLVPLRWLWHRGRPFLGPLAALALGALVVLLPVRSGSWKTFTHLEQEGAVGQLADMAEAFHPDDLVVFDGADDLALPIRVILGHRSTLVYFGTGIHAHQRLIRFLQRAPGEGEGRRLFLTSQPTLFGRPPERSYVLSWPKLEMTADRIPVEATRDRHVLNLFIFPDRKVWQYRTTRIDVGGADFPFIDGFYGAATHHRRMRHNFRRVGGRSVIPLPVGTVKVRLETARVEDGPAAVTVMHRGSAVDRYIPTREFSSRSVKVSRHDGLHEAGELVLLAEPLDDEGGGFSVAGVSTVVLMGRFGERKLTAATELPDWDEGWGPLETRDEVEPYTVRWTGPQARIRVPGSATLLRLNLSNGSRPRSLPPAKVSLRLNGRRVGGVIRPGSRLRTVDIPVPPSEYGRPSQVLTIESTTWNPYYAGRGGSLDRSLGVVVESLEIVRPNSSLERGLAKVTSGHHHEGLLLIQQFDDQFGRTSDWRIPLGLALAHEKAGRASLARGEYKESLSLAPMDNEAYRLLQQLAVRHDGIVRDREFPGWKEGDRREGPPALSEPWVLSLLPRGEGALVLHPGQSRRLAYHRLDHDGLAVVHLVAGHLEAGGSGGPPTADAGDSPPQVELLLDGASLGRLDLPEGRWQSLVATGLPAPGTAHTLEITLHGATPVEIKQLLAY